MKNEASGWFAFLISLVAAETAGYIAGGIRWTCVCLFCSIAIYAMAVAILARVREYDSPPIAEEDR